MMRLLGLSFSTTEVPVEGAGEGTKSYGLFLLNSILYLSPPHPYFDEVSIQAQRRGLLRTFIGGGLSSYSHASCGWSACAWLLGDDSQGAVALKALGCV